MGEVYFKGRFFPRYQGMHMTKLVKNVAHGIDVVNDVMGKIVSFFIPALILFETYEVLARYLFGHPTIWINELSAMFFGACILIGGGFTMYYEGHANMDIVYSLFSKRGRAIIDLITFFLFLAFVGVPVLEGMGDGLAQCDYLGARLHRMGASHILLQIDPAAWGLAAVASRIR